MKRLIQWLAILTLIIVLVYSKNAHKMDSEVVQNYYRQMIPTAAKYEPISDKTAKAVGQDGSLIAYLGVSSNNGYGGPILVGTIISPDGSVKDVLILEHKETPSYIDKITQAGYFRQYAKKQAADALVLDYDIDRVSGATLSTRAIAKSVQDVAHFVAVRELNATPDKARIDWKIGARDIVVTLLFVPAFLMYQVKALARFRIIILGLSVIILGFWLNRSLSMASIGALFIGYFPNPHENLIWYIVILGALVPALATGKNLYCTYVCPFCGLQELAHTVSRVNLPMGKHFKWIRMVKKVLLFVVLFLSFLFLNPSLFSYEPFGTIFGLNGSSYQWYLLFVILIASFFYRRFWCAAFCPVGTFLDKVAAVGRRIREIIRLSSPKRVRTVVVRNGE